METIPDRTVEPPIQASAGLTWKDPLHVPLAGGVPLFVLRGGEQEVCRIELLFRAGMRESADFLVPGAVSALLLNGTPERTAAAIAGHFEYYGASVDCTCTADYASVTVVCLNRFLPAVLPVVAEVMTGAAFPEDELNLYVSQCIQRLQVQNQKVGFVSKKILGKNLFGGTSPYGYCQTESGYIRLNSNELAAFHAGTYTKAMMAVIVSGLVAEEVIELIDSCFGAFHAGNPPRPEHGNGHGAVQRSVYEEWPASLQTSIRIGRVLFDRGHPDFIPMNILNCVLGGYFGSRLMANIREDKGFSYGIGSTLMPLHRTGCMYISAEVNKQARQDALREIYSEMKRLADEPVPDKELNLVKNYLSGMLQRTFDGPFATASSFRNVLISGMDFSYFRQYQEWLNVVTPGKLREIAAKYLGKEHFWEVCVG